MIQPPSPLAVVTGANSGMGLATTIELLRKGYRVVMLCRSASRGDAALQEVKQQCGSEAPVLLRLADLSSFASIRSFTEEFRRSFSQLDVLINNAGVITLKRETTEDGHERMLGVNHLGHFLLTNLLLEPLKAAPEGRVIVVSSGAYKAGRIHWGDIELTKGFNVVKGYAQSKLANILFAGELAERLSGTQVTVNSLHPGAVTTNLGVNRNSGFGKTVYAMLRPFFQTPTEGAGTAIYLATSPEVQGISGQYYYRKLPQPLAAKALDRVGAKRLWEWSEQATGL